MASIDEQEQRIAAILAKGNLDVNPSTLKIYHKYLKQQVEIPCELTGMEDFDWEEFYVIGPGSQKEYEKLKQTRPSYTDKFNLIRFIEKIGNEGEGILVEVERVKDKKRFTLP